MTEYREERRIKPIAGYEGLYSVTRDGRIYRHKRKKVKAGWVKLRSNTEYARVPLTNVDGKRKWHHVHRLVAVAFLPNPLNKPQVNHLNFNKHDNRMDNLEWVTFRENWEHARDNGRYRGTILLDDQQHEMYKLYCSGLYTQPQLANMFGVSKSSVWRYLKKQEGVRLAA